jgi:cholesterol transport system auxiliary component
MSDRSFTIDRRAILAAGVSTFTLGACSNIIGPPAASPLYVLKPDFPAAGTGAPVRWQLTVELPEASDSLDTMRIALVQANSQMDYYADAGWQDRLPYVVQSTLIEAFEASGRIASVGRDTEGLKSDYLLVSDIRDFQARYAAPDTPPAVVVRVVAKLIAARTRTIVMSTDARSEVQASQNNVVSVIAAFNQALTTVQQKIVQAALSAPSPAT